MIRAGGSKYRRPGRALRWLARRGRPMRSWTGALAGTDRRCGGCCRAAMRPGGGLENELCALSASRRALLRLRRLLGQGRAEARAPAAVRS